MAEYTKHVIKKIRAACEAIQVAAMAKKYIAMEEGQHEQALR